MREAASFIASQTSWAPAGMVAAGLDGLGRALRYWQSRRSLSRISEFDDHMLADIGLTREDVSWALGLPFSCEPLRELEARARRSAEGRWRLRR